MKLKPFNTVQDCK